MTPNPKGGNFTNLIKSYKAARREYPSEVITYVQSLLPKHQSLILDLGCGTGIATRQIASDNAVVIGCDPDAKMIQAALEITNQNVSYVVGSGGSIPFTNNSFDAITAFGSFHWILWHEKEKALKEIKRVLKPGGVFCIVNKADTSSLMDNLKKTIQKFSAETLPAVREGYEPEQILKSNNFSGVRSKIFQAKEIFTSEEALQLAQSMSAWNFVEEKNRHIALKEIESILKEVTTNGGIERKLKVVIVSGANDNKYF